MQKVIQILAVLGTVDQLEMVSACQWETDQKMCQCLQQKVEILLYKKWKGKKLQNPQKNS